jgi:aspartyl-tRNA(Asn)/glutamyl-tRNA(Gln) amidotransferase subunit A
MTSSLPVSRLLSLYRAKKLSPVEAAQDCLKQIVKYNPVLNAMCFLDEQGALRQARLSEKRWAKGEPKGALDGVPATVKDWYDVKGWPTRYGSLTSSEIRQPGDSPAAARLREEGAVLLGKTTLPEFGHKGVTDSPLNGVTRNPWNFLRTSGGSSGGAAVAAATGMAPLNLGSDAGGSIRIPASFCGVFGFKPSPGLVPAWPPSPFASFASAGPITRSAEDAAFMLDTLCKPDARDWNALPLPAPGFSAALKKPLPKLKIAWSPTINGVKPSKDVMAVLESQISALSALGRVEEIALDCPQVTDVFNKHWMAVAAWHVGRLPPAQRKRMDARYLEWARRGDALSLPDYLAATQTRAHVGAYFKGILDSYDLLITPATAMTAFDAGTDMPNDARGKPWFDWTPYTYPANLAKLPACALPAGLTKDGLPASFQVMAGYLKDAFLLQAAHRLEEALGFKGWTETQAA